jgi:hypothetical protein
MGWPRGIQTELEVLRTDNDRAFDLAVFLLVNWDVHNIIPVIPNHC